MVANAVMIAAAAVTRSTTEIISGPAVNETGHELDQALPQLNVPTGMKPTITLATAAPLPTQISLVDLSTWYSPQQSLTQTASV